MRICRVSVTTSATNKLLPLLLTFRLSHVYCPFPLVMLGNTSWIKPLFPHFSIINQKYEIYYYIGPYSNCCWVSNNLLLQQLWCTTWVQATSSALRFSSLFPFFQVLYGYLRHVPPTWAHESSTTSKIIQMAQPLNEEIHL
jgi:hypothetical protein